MDKPAMVEVMDVLLQHFKKAFTGDLITQVSAIYDETFQMLLYFKKFVLLLTEVESIL